MSKVFWKTISSFMVIFMLIGFLGSMIKVTQTPVSDLIMYLIVIMLFLFVYHWADEKEE